MDAEVEDYRKEASVYRTWFDGMMVLNLVGYSQELGR